MKRLIIALLLISQTVFAQVPQKGTTLQNAATAAGNGLTITTDGYTLISYQVEGSGLWTVIPEASLSGSTYNSLTCYQLDGITTTTSFGAAGTYRCNLAGNNIARARISAYTSGSVTVNATVSIGQAQTEQQKIQTVSGSGPLNGQLISTAPVGTAPIVIRPNNTTLVPYLNSSQLQGCTWAFPCSIGDGSPTYASFTSIYGLNGISQTATQSNNLGGTVTISNGTTVGMVTFPVAETDTNYEPIVSVIPGSGAPFMVCTNISSKTTAGFNINCSTSPGSGNSVVLNWFIVRGHP